MVGEGPAAGSGGVGLDAGRTIVAQVVVYGLGMAQGVLIARVLGPAGRGQYVLASLCAALFLTVFGGISAAVAFEVSRKQARVVRVMVNALVLACLLALPPLAAAGALWLLAGGAATWLPFAAAGAALGLFTACFNGLFLGLSEIDSLNRGQVITGFLTLALTAFLLGARTGVSGALSAWLGGAFLALAWMWRRSRLGTRELLAALATSDPAMTQARSLLGFTLEVGVINAVGFLNYRVDSFMVEKLVGLKALGIYSVAVGTAEVLWFVSRAVTTACYGRLGRESTLGAAALASKALRHTGFALALGALAIGSAAPFVLPMLYGSAFKEAVAVLLILLPGNMCFGLASILSAYFTNHLGRPTISVAVAAFSALVNVVISLASIPHLGMAGGALASTTSYAASVAVMYWLFIRKTGLPWRQGLLLTRQDTGEHLHLLRALILRKQ